MLGMGQIARAFLTSVCNTPSYNYKRLLRDETGHRLGCADKDQQTEGLRLTPSVQPQAVPAYDET